MDHTITSLAMDGIVVAVASNAKHEFSKLAKNIIRLVKDHGVEGDAHAGRFIQHRFLAKKMPVLPNNRQVHFRGWTHFGSRRLSKKFQSPRPNAVRPSHCRVLFLRAGLWRKDHRLDFNSYRRLSNEPQLHRRIWSVAPVQPVGASIAFSAGPDSHPRFFQEERRS